MTVRTCDMYGSDKVPNPLKGCVAVHYGEQREKDLPLYNVDRVDVASEMEIRAELAALASAAHSPH